MFQELTIQFTEQCTVSCPYCFAPIKSTSFLSRANFDTFVNFCGQETLDVIHITGGEPTLHPLFSDYITTLASLSSLVIYTNFTIENAVDGIKANKPSDIVFLVNMTSRDYCSSQQKRVMDNNIEKALSLGFRVALSYTFFDPSKPIGDIFNFLITMMRKYELRNLRLSQALSFDSKSFYSAEDINELYHYVAERILEWKEEGFSVYFDCPVPPCYVKQSDFKILRKHNAVSIKCIPKVFVMWDLYVTHCYSTMSADKKKPLKDFENLEDAKLYVSSILKRIQNESSRNGCYGCNYGKDGIPCGCPSYCV